MPIDLPEQPFRLQCIVSGIVFHESNICFLIAFKAAGLLQLQVRSWVVHSLGCHFGSEEMEHLKDLMVRDRQGGNLKRDSLSIL